MSRMTLRPALFGIAVRRTFLDYLGAVGLIMFVLLAVGLTIDLARHFPDIREAAETRETGLAPLLAPYLLHRSVDIVARLLPMATLFGVLLAELIRRFRLESTILSAAGFSPRRGAAALVWLALVLGSLQGLLEARWRPAAVLAQVESGFGNYANWYRRGWLRGPVWFVEQDRAFRAQIRRTDRPEMRNLLIFEGIRAPRLQRVISAGRAYPLDQPQHWRLEDVRIWSTATEGRAPEALPAQDIVLDLIPEQLSWYGVREFNIPGPVLRTLAARPTAGNGPAVRTAVWRRRTAWLLPGILAVLASTLSRHVFGGRLLLLPRLVALSALGYVSVVANKVFWDLGVLGNLPAPLAVLLPLLFAGLLALVLARRRL